MANGPEGCFPEATAVRPWYGVHIGRAISRKTLLVSSEKWGGVPPVIVFCRGPGTGRNASGFPAMQPDGAGGHDAFSFRWVISGSVLFRPPQRVIAKGIGN